MTAKKRYSAFSLVELLIVIAIFIVLTTIGVSGFYGLKDSLTISEEVSNLELDIRYAQRAALFLERKTTDRWIYGIGIDFSKVESTGKYNFFKWCSPFDDYGDEKTKSSFPNFTPGQNLSAINGNFPPTASYGFADCPKGSAISALSMFKDTGDMSISSNFVRDLPNANNAVGDVSSSYPVYLLFESVSGRAFFYDSTGVLVNYDTTGAIVANPVPFQLDITSKRIDSRKRVTVSNISGKVDVTTLEAL